MGRPRKIVTCIEKHIGLTVGKSYMVIDRNRYGIWVMSDNGYIRYVDNRVFGL